MTRFSLVQILVLALLSSLVSANSGHKLSRRTPDVGSLRSHTSSTKSRLARRSPFAESEGALHLPLHKVARSDKNVHPQILLQQHINRGVRRAERMSGRQGPSDEELSRRLMKRWVSIQPEVVELRKRAFDESGQLRKRHVGRIDQEKDMTSISQMIGRLRGVAGLPAVAIPRVAAAINRTFAIADVAGGFDVKTFDAALENLVTVAEAPKAANTLGLDIESANIGYFATLEIGTPPLPYKVLMDSGSADFWVPSEDCTNCGKVHQKLGKKSSSSLKLTSTAFDITYGTGDVAGVVVSEHVKFAGLELDDLEFGVTLRQSKEFSDDNVPFDGLMGLAQSILSSQKVLTAVEALAERGVIARAQVGYKMGRAADDVNDGQISFGGVDSSKFKGRLVQLKNINTQGFWEANLDGVTVNGKDTRMKGRTAILDTGTTLLVAPAADAEAIHALIPGARSDGSGGFILPCTSRTTVSLSFGGTFFDINPIDLLFLPVTNDLEGDCVSGISSGQIGGDKQWLVGDTFLRSVYFATDVEANAIGLAVS